MQNIIIGLLIAVLLAWAVWRTARRARRGSACCGEREEGEARVSVGDRNPAHYPYTVRMEIGGMTCENCARRVDNALNALDGVWAKVDIGKHSAKLRCKSQPELKVLEDAVRGAGYAALSCLREK